MSYWIYQADKYSGISLESSKNGYELSYPTQEVCNLDFSAKDEPNEYTQIAPVNLFFPVIFFMAFAVFAMSLQMYHQWTLRKGTTYSTLVGRQSSLNLMSNSKDDDNESTQVIQKTDESSNSLNGGSLQKGVHCELSADTSKSNGSLLPQASDFVSTIARGSFGLDASVKLDEFRDNCIDQTAKANTGLLISQCDARSQLYTLVETGALDDFLVCVHKIKEQKQV